MLITIPSKTCLQVRIFEPVKKLKKHITSMSYNSHHEFKFKFWIFPLNSSLNSKITPYSSFLMANYIRDSSNLFCYNFIPINLLSVAYKIIVFGTKIITHHEFFLVDQALQIWIIFRGNVTLKLILCKINCDISSICSCSGSGS